MAIKRMNKLTILSLILICQSCIGTKPVAETVLLCDEKKAIEWATACVRESGTDTTSERIMYGVKKDCYTEAKRLFCKPVKGISIKNRFYNCDSVPKKYLRYCK